MKKLRVLHTPHNNGGHRWLISREERKLGIASDLVVVPDQPFYQNYDRCLHINSKTIPNEIKRYLFIKEAIKKYDIFHFNAGASVLDHPFPGLNLLDLPMIKRAKKKIVVTYQGDDCRQKDYYIKHYGVHYRSSGYTLNDWYLDTNKRRRVRIFDKYADHIFAISPDIMNFLPKRTEFLGTCVALDQYRPMKKKPSRSIKIVHAPSDRVIKGTETILSVVKELSLRYPIELILIEHLPHEKAIEAYHQADIGIDQLVVGWYGTFAVELMALGVPVIAYLRNDDLVNFVPFHHEIPVINADKNDLRETLILLLEDKMLRERIGRMGPEYVKRYHNPQKIAKRLLEVYKG